MPPSNNNRNLKGLRIPQPKGPASLILEPIRDIIWKTINCFWNPSIKTKFVSTDGTQTVLKDADIQMSPLGWTATIDLTEIVAGSAGGSGSGSSNLPKPFKFVRDGGDYYVVNTWDGSTAGTINQFIHKDPKLRAGAGAIASEVFGGITYTYTYNPVYFSGSSGPVKYYTLSVSGSDGSSGTYYVTPDVLVDDIIYGMELSTYDDPSNLHRSILDATIWTSGGGEGSGYTAGDVLSVSGGTGSAATITVDTVDGSGKILTAHISDGGDYTTAPSLINPLSGGTGTGAIFVLTLAPILIDAIGGKAWAKS